MSTVAVLSGSMLLAGSFLLLAASLGLLRFPDLQTRMHAVVKAGTIGAVVAVSSIAAADVEIVTRVGGAIVVLLLSAPAGAFLLSRPMHEAGRRAAEGSAAPDSGPRSGQGTKG